MPNERAAGAMSIVHSVAKLSPACHPLLGPSSGSLPPDGFPVSTKTQDNVKVGGEREGIVLLHYTHSEVIHLTLTRHCLHIEEK